MAFKLLCLAFVACLSAGAAQAQAYSKLSGSHLDFYFDASIVDMSNVSVTGDTVQFDALASISNTFVVVPHSDVLLSNSVSGRNTVQFGYGWGYMFGNIYVYSAAQVDVSSGTFNHGAFASTHDNVASSGGRYDEFYSGGYFEYIPIDPCEVPDPYYGCSIPQFVSLPGTVDKTLGWDGQSSRNDAPGYFKNALQVTYSTYAWGDTSVDPRYLVLSFDTVLAVPEPATYALLLAGLALLAGAARRRRH